MNLEKRNNVKKHIRKLHVSGVITTDPYQILEEQKRFYDSLYDSQFNDINSKISETFLSNNVIFDISKKKSKDFYSLIVRRKAQLPSNAKKLSQNFNFTEEELKLAFALPHKVAYEPYVKAFQYKILNSILYIINIFWTNFEKYLFMLTNKISSSQHSRYYIRHCDFALPLTELFNING